MPRQEAPVGWTFLSDLPVIRLDGQECPSYGIFSCAVRAYAVHYTSRDVD